MGSSEITEDQLLQIALDMYDHDRVLVAEFFNTAIPALGDNKIDDLKGSVEGRNRVYKYLCKLSSGELLA
ncbi:hypothetical protein AB4254_11910 [Vibrio breoganii]